MDEALLKLVRQIGLKDDAGYGLFDCIGNRILLPYKPGNIKERERGEGDGKREGMREMSYTNERHTNR